MFVIGNFINSDANDAILHWNMTGNNSPIPTQDDRL